MLEGVVIMTGLRNLDPGTCGDMPVGPIIGSYTPEEVYAELIKPICTGTFHDESSSDRGRAGSNLWGSRRYEFNIDRTTRLQALRQIGSQTHNFSLTSFIKDPQQEQELVGPIVGNLLILEALMSALIGSDLVVRWIDENWATVEPRPKNLLEWIPRSGVCRPCNISLANIFKFPPLSEHVVVVRSRLAPALEEYIQSPVNVLDRNVERTGAATVPDLLRYLPQTAFSRPSGYRLSGAQFAEMRGLGAENTLVLINGRRAYASAVDFYTSAFDLNTIPLTAVERVELSYDAPSLAHGMDAIGGVINIVLRDNVDRPSVEARYGSARGGAAERRGMLSAGAAGDRARASFVLDYFEVDQLLGAERDRWRNQDYTRYGSSDQRSPFSAPANVRSLDGGDLPGLGSPFAAVVPGTSGVGFRPGEVNLTSLDAFQAIMPNIKRASFYGSAKTELGASTLSGESLLTQRDTKFRLVPSIVPGFVVPDDHPQNPFGVPVAVEAALTGLPPQDWNMESHLVRSVLELSGPVGRWSYSAFVLHSEERGKSWRENYADFFGVMNALSAGGGEALNIFTDEPGAGPIPSGVMAPKTFERSSSGGTQFTAKLSGRLVDLPGGEVSTNIGVERRREFGRFDAGVGGVHRDVTSAFAQVKVPIVDSEMRVPAVHDLRFNLGARRDHYSDVRAISRGEYGITWHPIQTIKVHATHSESYRPPSLYDLYFPRLRVPTQIFDPRRNELASLVIVTGGNTELEPTIGSSSSVGVAFEDAAGLRASIDFWQTKLRDRVALVLPQALLANEDAAISGRIVRENPTAADVEANRPGRLASLDISRANFGRTEIRGADVSLERPFKTTLGVFKPRLDVTYTDAFRYSDLPVTGSPLKDRAGIASESGTVTKMRAVASLSYEGYGWSASVAGRSHSSYDDYIATLGQRTGRKIPSRTIWDFNVSKTIGKHLRVTLGASDLRNKEPPFSEVGGHVGYDSSQGDLTGRTIYASITGSL